ncbi:uncharacterized protein LOC135171371 [Diachasmimorpha longicaudata]|uniref:uncharacterized protein LOC135171371 n=1 Tax=Diachasmimorpha longicaudata TaxID=58733 RepID=UPI0030B8C7F3
MRLRTPSHVPLIIQLLLRIFGQGYSWLPVGHSCYVQTRYLTRFACSSNLVPKFRSSPINSSFEVDAYILNLLTALLPTFASDHGEWGHLRGLELSDPEFLTPAPVDVILGADVYGQLILPDIRTAGASSPTAQLTHLGWIVFGPTGGTESSLQANTHLATTNDELNNLLTKFWVQAEIPETSTASLSEEEAQCEAHFRLTHTRGSSGRYIVRLPLKASTSSLGDTRSFALACLH